MKWLKEKKNITNGEYWAIHTIILIMNVIYMNNGGM